MSEVVDQICRSSSRAPAIVVGALVPLMVGVIVIIALLATFAYPPAPLKEGGSAGLALLMLPGLLLFGSLFAFPISASLVVSMTWLMRRCRFANHTSTWTLVGPIFALPASLILWQFDLAQTVPVGLLLGLSLGLIGGYSAGANRPRIEPSARTGDDLSVAGFSDERLPGGTD